MQIKYETSPNGLMTWTKCPNGQKTSVGSMYCSNCSYYVGQTKDTVECNFKKES